MKRKVFDLRDWPRVPDHACAVTHTPDHALVDYVAHTVARPLDVATPGALHQTRVLDSGFRWVRAHPRSGEGTAGYAVTAMLDTAGRPAQFYIDLHGGEGLHESGFPWHDDLYLDVIGRPDPLDPWQVQATEIIDGDELEEAVTAGLVTPDIAARTWAHARQIAAQLQAGTLPELEVLRAYVAAHRATP